MPPTMLFSPPPKSLVKEYKSPEAVIGPDAALVVSKVKGKFVVGIMDKADETGTNIRLHVVYPSTSCVWVGTTDIKYKVTSVEDGIEALKELEKSSPSPTKSSGRVWLSGCPMQLSAEELGLYDEKPAEQNMRLCKEFFTTRAPTTWSARETTSRAL